MGSVDLTGHNFGSWAVRSVGGSASNGARLWNCQCICGKSRPVSVYSLVRGVSTNCGCKRKRTLSAVRFKHGHSRAKTEGGKQTRTYRIWCAMHARCRGSTEHAREYYQSRGVTVCDRWKDYSAFLGDMGEAPAKYSIDRFPDRDGIYEPTNCRWATASQQAYNRRPERWRHRPKSLAEQPHG